MCARFSYTNNVLYINLDFLYDREIEKYCIDIFSFVLLDNKNIKYPQKILFESLEKKTLRKAMKALKYRMIYYDNKIDIKKNLFYFEILEHRVQK